MKPSLSTAIGCLLGMAGAATAFNAAAAAKIEIDDTHWVSIGAGLRTAFTSVEDAAPSGEDRSNDFAVQNMRLYVAGQVHENVKLTFNTECVNCADADAEIIVLDAIAQFEFSDAFNLWVGRMLTPADRIEMNGPFYSLTPNQYTVPLFPSDQGGDAGRFGRDDGATVWGRFDRFQYAVGLFDGYDGASNEDDNLLLAGRFAYNVLALEANPGYYTSSTYFGEAGDVFTLAAFFQSQSDGVGTSLESTDFTAYGVDVLFEKVFGDAGVLTLEGEYKMFDVDLTEAMVGTTDPADPCFCLFDGDTYFVSAAYLLPGRVGIGRFQPYLRYTSNEPDDFYDDSDLVEVGVNYVISGHNTKLHLTYTDGDANLSGIPGADVNGLMFGVQVQI